MNDATLRRLQQRMRDEGYKDPEDTAAAEGVDEEADPAVDDSPCDHQEQHQIIHSAPSSPPLEEEDDAWVAEQVRLQEEYFLRQQQQRTTTNAAAAAATTTTTTSQPGGDDSAAAAGSRSAEGDEELEEDNCWGCDSCGYDSALHLNFCGVCGDARPQDWWCHHCDYPNSHFHNFCGMCGKDGGGGAQPSSALGYEDMGLPAAAPQDEDRSVHTEEEEAAIRAAVARMSHHVVPVAPYGGEVDEEDDVSSFAADSCGDAAADNDDDAEQAAPVPVSTGPTSPNRSTGWCCAFCTFANDNPQFLSCEMCGSARPPTPVGSPTPSTSKRLQAPQPAPSSSKETDIRRQGSNASSRGSSSKESDDSKLKEKRLTEIMRLQQGMFQLAQGGEHQGEEVAAGGATPEPETDHELAMIYAQQERILAEYQRQQQQQQYQR